MDADNFENPVDELQEFCTGVKMYGTTEVPVQIPEYNELMVTLNAWRLPEGTACMVTAGPPFPSRLPSRGRKYRNAFRPSFFVRKLESVPPSAGRGATGPEPFLLRT